MPDRSCMRHNACEATARPVGGEAVRLSGTRRGDLRQRHTTGQLIILGAGDESLYTECVPLFDKLGKKALYLGAVGAGARMKLVVNMVMGTMMGAFSEGMALADQVRRPPEPARGWPGQPPKGGFLGKKRRVFRARSRSVARTRSSTASRGRCWTHHTPHAESCVSTVVLCPIYKGLSVGQWGDRVE